MQTLLGNACTTLFNPDTRMRTSSLVLRSLLMAWTLSRAHHQENQMLLLAKVSNYQYLHEIAECVGWKKLWDRVLITAPQLLKA